MLRAAGMAGPVQKAKEFKETFGKDAALTKKYGIAPKKPLMTRWAKAIAEGERDFLREYPRPQLVRAHSESEEKSLAGFPLCATYTNESYYNLNGEWEFAVTSDNEPQEADWRSILVPFSPECELGGAMKPLRPDQTLWYRKVLTVKKKLPAGNRVLLHFQGVDQICTVYVDGARIKKHVGGYLPFAVDITEHMTPGAHELRLCVTDPTERSAAAYGKQKRVPGGMFYTAQSGIWQTVWMERVPTRYLAELKIDPDYDTHSVRIRVYPSEGSAKTLSWKCEIWFGDENEPEFSVSKSIKGTNTHTFDLGEGFKGWTPERPDLYRVRIVLGKDEVCSYFAMRIFTREIDADGISRLCLNHKPYFVNGVLSQGYWAGSLMTAPSDEALTGDINAMKNAGFNMMRVHCKIESLRFYYHCDRMGMLVWQDMVNGGAYHALRMTYAPTLLPKYDRKRDSDYARQGRKKENDRKIWQRECIATVRLLYNAPSVCAWVLFNEGWGQFNAVDATRMVRGLDKSRWIDHASGWFDQGVSDMHSVHRYFQDLVIEEDTPEADAGRAFVISEYGGVVLRVPGHTYGTDLYGYRTCRTFTDFYETFSLLQENIRSLVPKGLAGAVYTQVSDIEEEMNGILTYDRTVNKIAQTVKDCKKN